MIDEDPSSEPMADDVASDTGGSDRPQADGPDPSERPEDISAARDLSGVDPQASISGGDPSNAEFHDRLTDESSH